MIIKKEFYFIRHGQIDYNASTAKTDHADVSLNAVGLKQATDAEPLIASLPVNLTNMGDGRLNAYQRMEHNRKDVWHLNNHPL